MGIEPTRAAPPGLENKRFGATADPKCDGRVNFRGMWGYLRPHRGAITRFSPRAAHFTLSANTLPVVEPDTTSTT